MSTRNRQIIRSEAPGTLSREQGNVSGAAIVPGDLLEAGVAAGSIKVWDGAGSIVGVADYNGVVGDFVSYAARNCEIEAVLVRYPVGVDAAETAAFKAAANAALAARTIILR